jgi:ABC-type antimicrobial peptide transport system permease subunit
VIERLVAQLSAAFGLLALGLAAVGAYGLTAYVTAQRTVEIGIRMALGGDQRAARRLVARDIFVLVGTGVAIGLPIALVAGRLLASQLYQTHPSDPIAIGAGLVTLCAAALIAGYIPARRAARVDPLVALRCE